MIPRDILQSADYYHWLGDGTQASRQLGCHPSTISRHLQSYGQAISWLADSNQQRLINLEREVHQHWRFQTGTGLRIHLYPWTNQLTHGCLPDPWTANPLEVAVTQCSAMELLRTRMIDAICAPYPVIASAQIDQLALIPLYSTPLIVLANRHGTLANERGLTRHDIGSISRLASLPFVPVEASRCSEVLDAFAFAGDPGSGSQPAVAGLEPRHWGTPLTPLVSPQLKVIDYQPDAVYGECLAVLPDWQEHPCVLQLCEHLARQLHNSPLIQALCPEIRVLMAC